MRHNLELIASTALITLVIMFVANQVNHDAPGLFVAPASAGGVTGVTNDMETLYTASQDGRTIFMWQAYGSKPPKFVGQSAAVLSK